MSAEVRMRHRQGDFLLDVEFSFGAGVTALFGPSGAGKSTVINGIAGLIRPDDGRVTLDGVELFDSARGVSVPVHKRRIGVVFQDTRLFPHLSVRNNLLFGWRRVDERAPDSEIERIIAMLGLEPMLDRKPHTLSGGERSRVALGRALLMNPRLLLLDEPLAALDASRKAEIFPYFERLHDETKIPVLYVSHSTDEVARLADHVVLIREGRIAAQGSIFDITSRLDLATGVDRLLPGTVLDAVVVRHDGTGLSELAFAGQTLIVPKVARDPGAHVRIRIDAQDVMLALAEPQQVSANNVLAATVAAVRTDGPGPEADVQLAIGDARLLARITKRSAARLALQQGTHVFAVIKSVTVGGRDPR
jgi:molybdate transport system ATP-binding protein